MECSAERSDFTEALRAPNESQTEADGAYLLQTDVNDLLWM